jgi:hypothetical protein
MLVAKQPHSGSLAVFCTAQLSATQSEWVCIDPSVTMQVITSRR